jgi:hypothetical protein
MVVNILQDWVQLSSIRHLAITIPLVLCHAATVLKEKRPRPSPQGAKGVFSLSRVPLGLAKLREKN